MDYQTKRHFREVNVMLAMERKKIFERYKEYDSLISDAMPNVSSGFFLFPGAHDIWQCNHYDQW